MCVIAKILTKKGGYFIRPSLLCRSLVDSVQDIKGHYLYFPS